MSITQQHEAQLLRCQLDSCRAAADIQIEARRKERDAALDRAAAAEQNFRHLIWLAIAGWCLFTILAVACALHYGLHHSSSSRALGEVAASPSFSEVTK